MAEFPGIGRATRFGVSRTFSLAAALTRAALAEDSDREALRVRATDAFSDLWEATLDALLRTKVIERTTDRLLSEGVVERVVERTTDRLLSEGVVERVVVLVLEHPATDRLVTRLVDSPGFERLVLSVVHSELFDQLLDRVLASEQLDRVVTQIAESDEVAGALREQSAGMADEVTDELRSRTIAADAMLERLARAIIRRRPSPPGSGPAGSGAL